MTDLNESLNKVMAESVFIHRGCVIEVLIGGFRIFSHKVKTMDEVDKIINQSQKIISESTKKGSR